MNPEDKYTTWLEDAGLAFSAVLILFVVGWMIYGSI